MVLSLDQSGAFTELFSSLLNSERRWGSGRKGNVHCGLTEGSKVARTESGGKGPLFPPPQACLFSIQARQILEKEFGNLVTMGTDRRLDEVSLVPFQKLWLF